MKLWPIGLLVCFYSMHASARRIEEQDLTRYKEGKFSDLLNYVIVMDNYYPPKQKKHKRFGPQLSAMVVSDNEKQSTLLGGKKRDPFFVRIQKLRKLNDGTLPLSHDAKNILAKFLCDNYDRRYQAIEELLQATRDCKIHALSTTRTINMLNELYLEKEEQKLIELEAKIKEEFEKTIRLLNRASHWRSARK